MDLGSNSKCVIMRETKSVKICLGNLLHCQHAEMMPKEPITSILFP